MTVLFKNLTRPANQIIGPLADWMLVHQEQFKILDSVIRPVAIPVMNVLVHCQRSAELFGQDEPMLRHVTKAVRHWVSALLHEDIPGAADNAPAFPLTRLIRRAIAILMSVNVAQRITVILHSRRHARFSYFRLPPTSTGTNARQQSNDFRGWLKSLIATGTGLLDRPTATFPDDWVTPRTCHRFALGRTGSWLIPAIREHGCPLFRVLPRSSSCSGQLCVTTR